MKLQEVFKQLTYGELSQLNIGGTTVGEISEDNYERVLTHINLGLTALHTRFSLKEGSLVVGLLSNTYEYSLSGYGDLLKVEKVFTDTGFELGLNDDSNQYAIKTPSYNVIRVHKDIVAKKQDMDDRLKTDTLDIVYRANHPYIDSNGINPFTYEVQLPYSHLEALLFYVASRINNPIGMGQEFNAGNTYAMKYEAECSRLETLNLRVDQGSQNTRLERNGWV